MQSVKIRPTHLVAATRIKITIEIKCCEWIEDRNKKAKKEKKCVKHETLSGFNFNNIFFAQSHPCASVADI